MLYNVTTDMNKDLLVECLKFYREFTIDSCGEIDVLGMWDHEDHCSSTRHLEAQFYSDVQELIDKVEQGKSLTTDQWWAIYDMLADAVDQWDISRGETGVLNDFEYDDAQHMMWVIKMEVSEHVVTNYRMVRVLADALLGRYGADIGNLKLLSSRNANTSVRGYIEDLDLKVADYTVVTAWAMAILGTREDNNQQVEDLALELADIF